MEMLKIDGERRHSRRLEGAYVEYALIPDYNSREEAVYKPCFLRNFHLGGVSIQITEPFSDPVLIGVHIFDPNSPRPIKTIGRVIWKDMQRPNLKLRPKYDIGLKFLEMNKDDQRRLIIMYDFLASDTSETYTITGKFE